MSVADRNKNDTELMYSLLTEGKLDLMYLPAGAIAWLWDRPEAQVHAARDLAVAAKDICPVTDAALLRSDQNVLILKCEDGHKFNVYPDGGYGCDGEPLDVHGCMRLLDNGMEPVEPEECPMEGGVAPQPGLEYMPPNPPNMPAEMAYMEEGAENYWGPKEWTQHYKMRKAEGASPEELSKIKARLNSVKHGHMKTAEDEGDESIIDRDRENRFVDSLCKVRSIGSDFMKNMGMEEGEGSQGIAGPIGTDMYDFEDELAQIGAFVEEELKKHRD